MPSQRNSVGTSLQTDGEAANHSRAVGMRTNGKLRLNTRRVQWFEHPASAICSRTADCAVCVVVKQVESVSNLGPELLLGAIAGRSRSCDVSNRSCHGHKPPVNGWQVCGVFGEASAGGENQEPPALQAPQPPGWCLFWALWDHRK